MTKAPPSFQPRFADRMSGMQASEIRELLKVIDQPGVISFAGGIPDPALFPKQEINDAYSRILQSPKTAGRALQYSVSEGDPDLRRWIVDHMAAKGVPCSIDNILITSGSQQALEFIGKLFVSPQDTVLLEAPTYLGALQAFAANQPKYETLGFKGNNRPAASYLKAAQQSGNRVSYAYVVPDFANPTGETLGVSDRQNLLKLAQELACPIIEDSPYSALRYEGAPMRAIQALDIDDCGSINRSRVLHCGSFSKVFTPGLRVGWICASTEIISRLCLIKQASDLNSPAINQLVMLELAQSLYDSQIAKNCATYRQKRDVMLMALDKYMPKSATYTRPEGGMFIWLTVPEGADTAALLKKSIAEIGVAFVPGHAFFADKTGRNTMRLNFSLPNAGEIEQGIKALAGIV